MQSDVANFAILDRFEEDFVLYYRQLYGLILEKRTVDNTTFFYLEFPTVGKGKLSNPAMYVELEARATIVACILANLYFTNFFSYDKKFQWDDIQYEIEHGEHKDSYQQLFFKDARAEYSENEWKDVRRHFGIVINFFSRIGLVEKEENDEEMQFTILPSIHHFIELYRDEIENIDDFLKEIKL